MSLLKKINVFNLAICLLLPVLIFAAEDKDVALVLKTIGNVQLTNNNQNGWTSAGRGNRLNSGQVVKTGEKSLAALVFTDDKSLLKVRSNSNVTINGKREDNSIVKRIKLSFGEIWAKVTKQDTKMRVESPSGVATVKGTIFNCLVVDNNFFVYCQEGLMELVNQFGTLLLGANEMAQLTPNSAPQRIEGDPNEIFDLSDDDEKQKLEFEFEDEAGNKKRLILDFEEN